MPPPPIAALCLKILSGIQLVGLAFVVLGTNVFSFLGMTTVPSWYGTIEKNGMQLAILVYLLLPPMLSKYVVTGAFEVVLDDSITVFSKIALGRMPQYQDLVDPLVRAGLELVTDA